MSFTMSAAKIVIGAVSSFGASTVVSNAIKATTPETMNTATKIGVAIGSVVVSSALADTVTKNFESHIDSMTSSIAETREKVNEWKTKQKAEKSKK